MTRASRLAAAALAAVLLTGAAPPPPAPSPSPSPTLPSEERRRQFCSLVRQCGLPPVGAPFCPDGLANGAPGVRYDAERCEPARELSALGFQPTDALGFPVYRFLGRRYRVVYGLTGRAPVSAARLAYLVDELPFACRLVTHFRKKTYEAEWLRPDRRRFRARKDDDVSGEGELIAAGAAGRTLFYFGVGRSKVGPWRLSGQGLLRLTYQPAPGDPGAIDYEVKVVACPDNAVLNVIMNMGMFRGIVQRRLRETISDLTLAAHALQGAPTELPGNWSAEDRARLAALRRLP